MRENMSTDAVAAMAMGAETTANKPMGLHHVAIISSTMESVAFYEKLGFREKDRIRRRTDTVVLMQGNGIWLELFVDPSHPPRSTQPERIGIRHLALQVENLEIAAAGFECGPICRDWHGSRYVMIFDPDGLPIELRE